MRKYLLTSIVSLLVCLVLSQAEAQVAVAQEEILSDQTILDQTDSVETKFSTAGRGRCCAFFAVCGI